MKIINKLQKNTQTLKTYHLFSLPLVITNFRLGYQTKTSKSTRKRKVK